MNTAVQKADVQPHPLVRFKAELAKVSEDFPTGGVPVEKIKSAIVVAVQKNPDLLRADRATFWQAARSCAADGLLPDGREAALVAFKGMVQYMPMVAGLIRRARNSGDIRALYARTVRKNDGFKLWIDEETGDQRFSHDFNPFASQAERGELVGAYAVARLRDGVVEFEAMSLDEIEDVRKAGHSQGGSAQPKGIWARWYDEMAKKTVIRRICKRLPLASENMAWVQHDDDMLLDDPRTAPKPRRGGVAYGAAALPPVTDDAPEVDEVLDAEPATDEAPADPPIPDFDPDQDRRQAGLIG